MFHYEKPPVITEYVVYSPKLKENESLCFACISDLHECEYGTDNKLLLEALESIKPDGILIPGDFVNSSADGDCRKTMGLLKELKARYENIFYAPGNHERKIFERIGLFNQMALLRKGLKEAGVSLMRNEWVSFGSNLRIYGLDLNKGFYRKFIIKRIPPRFLERILGRADEKSFNILLAHDPEHFPEYIRWKPDLILSGHVHGGIIRLPLFGGLISPALLPFPKYDSGLYEKNGVKMIVSRGAGSHSIDIRINNPAEILKIVIRGETGKK